MRFKQIFGMVSFWELVIVYSLNTDKEIAKKALSKGIRPLYFKT